MALADIDTIVVVMLENRSFDHMLGYLSLDETPNRMAVDGLRSDPQWQSSYANRADGAPHPLKPISVSQPIDQDPPHNKDYIATQIDSPPAGPGPTKMGGFVSTYLEAHKRRVDDPGVVMGYYDRAGVPVYDFLARNFCVCDKWFTPLPLGTQANRLMAMAGESRVVDNVSALDGLPRQRLAYDWLKANKVSWRVYVSGGFAPFFLLMPHWRFPIFKSLALGSGKFRRFGKLRKNWPSNTPMPSVVFIEPEYSDAPQSSPNDDHPPASIAAGQHFIRTIYEILTSNPARWSKTLMIVTYDEHGGFFDHVEPLPIRTDVNGVRFDTTGPRVPALLISPHVAAGQVFSEPLDHTSILQLIAARFGKGAQFSDAVTARQASLGRIANALLATPRTGAAPEMPAAPAIFEAVLATAPVRAPTAPDTPNAAAIDSVMRDLAAKHPELIDQPGWQEMKVYLETNPRPVPRHFGHIGDANEL